MLEQIINYGKFSFKFFAFKLWESITVSLKLLPPNSFRAHYKLDFLVLSDQ